MAQLFGREWTKRELLERVGDLSQVAGAEAFTYSDGGRDGLRAARVRSGGGLDYTVLLSRGMDIGQASYRGVPLAWISATGASHPHAFETQGRGWLRTFHGGLLTGCGLLNAGAANTDGDEPLGIHGHLSHIPAEETVVGAVWTGDEAEVIVSGTMREATVFGENLHLTRKITSRVGSAGLAIHDTVENLGFRETPLMLLYHLNFGWPLVSEDTEIVYAAASPVTPRDRVAEAGLSHWMHLHAPIPGYEEQCFFHDPVADSEGMTRVLMLNRARQIGVRIAYDKAALPHLTQWKMTGQSEYVCGIEPANCKVMGRSAERAAGRLQTLAPGEVREFRVFLEVLDGLEAITAAEQAVAA
ncbi:MAG: aldose 1-epimerase family protein [Cytophagales bacterium]|nr:aldose 1-epimerase family protein [Armatimonadota bacterium]